MCIRDSPYTAPKPEPEEELASTPRGDREPQAWITEIVAAHPVVVFMKGTPMSPQCGFSANAAAILRAYEKPLYTVDVIADPEVRRAVKEFSNWPTIPQIYIGGEFMGGSDILQQMQGNGELDEAIGEAFARAKAAEEAAGE